MRRTRVIETFQMPPAFASPTAILPHHRNMSSSTSSSRPSDSQRRHNKHRGRSHHLAPYANQSSPNSASHWFSSASLPTDPFTGPPLLQTLPTQLNENTIALLWFRNDLRLLDNAAVTLACTGSLLAPIYVFDLSNRYGRRTRSPWGFHRVGPFRAQFIKENVKSLQNELRHKRTDMYIRHGDTVKEIISLARDLATNLNQPVAIIAQKETTWEELQEEQFIEKGIKELSEELEIPMDVHWTWSGSTLHHPGDLPFNPTGPSIPRTFTAYRKLMESQTTPVAVREELPIPEEFPRFPLSLRLRNDPLPSLRIDLQVEGLADPLDYPYPHPNGVHPFDGGLDAANERIEEYIWRWEGLEDYKDTRNKSGIRNSSSKFAPYLSAGVLSARTIYKHVKDFEAKHADETQHTYWMILELMTRDYFRWLSASSAVGNKLFALNGFSGPDSGEKSTWISPRSSLKEKELLQKWVDGMTGAPFVDASMRELKFTGFMSNRGRQNVASFLVHDMKFPDWRAGAEYFEAQLIDHDVASNWGNWAYVAGVGSDPRARKFNVIKQSMDYEPDGWFITRWCPEIMMVPPPMIHQPHLLEEDEKELLEIEGYPDPIVALPTAPAKLAESLIGQYDLPRSKKWAERVKQDFIDAGAHDMTRTN